MSNNNDTEEFLDIEEDVMALYNGLLESSIKKKDVINFLVAAKNNIFKDDPLPDTFPNHLTSKVSDLKEKIVNWIKALGNVPQNDFNGLMEEFEEKFKAIIEHENPIFHEGGRRRRRNHKSKRKVRKTHKKTKRARKSRK